MSRLRRGRSKLLALGNEGDDAVGSAAAELAALKKEEAEAEAAHAAAADDGSEAPHELPAARVKGKRKAAAPKKGRAKRARVASAEEEAAAAPVPTHWSCPVCTFQNEPAALKCGMCAQEKPADGGSAAATWRCNTCTVSNDAASWPFKCAMCGSARTVVSVDGADEVDLTGGSSSSAAAASSSAAASAPASARRRAEPPRLQDNLTFLAGLEESIGTIHVDEYLKTLLVRLVNKQWTLLESKFKDVPEADFPKSAVTELQKSLVHAAVKRALAIRDRMQLVMDCAQAEIVSLESSCCMHCSEPGSSAELLFTTSNCAHTMCLRCVKKLILAKMDSKDCLALSCPASGCDAELAPRSIRRALSRKEYEEFNDLCFQLTLADPSKFHKCPTPGCKAEPTEIVRLSSAPKVPKGGITLTDASGKKLSEKAWIHYSEFRIRCPSCQLDHCRECRASPYHLGMTCSEFKEYASSRHCRCCTEQLKPGSTDDSMPNGLAVCTAEHCQQMKARSCTHKLECGHACYGVRGEKEHPPCLEEDCPAASDKCDGSENCAICYGQAREHQVEELRHAGPVVQLSSCGHVYHESCVLEKISKRWAGTRITFGFLDCSKCKTRMNHPSADIRAALEPIERLYAEVRAKAMARLKIENMTKDAKLVTPGSQFFNKPEAYALASFAYYNCFKCRKFYFGGRRDCEQNAAAEVRPEEEFVCFDCADLKSVKCKNAAHSEDQCRFCCKPAVWFCFGTTHFCDPCHVRPGEVMGRRRDATPQCPGPALCPLKVAHAPNGPDADCEFNVGCGICQEKVSDFMAAKQKEEKVNEAIEAEAAAASISPGGRRASRR